LNATIYFVNVILSGDMPVNTSKLKEALVELQQQRAILDGAISNIQRIIAMMNGGSETVSEVEPKARRSSYIDEGVKVLEISGQPLHIKEIAKRISEMRGHEVGRPSVESSFIRHISMQGNKSRIVKVRPAYFGLPAWKSITHEPKLTTTA
jgi:reverse gyrase